MCGQGDHRSREHFPENSPETVVWARGPQQAGPPRAQTGDEGLAQKTSPSQEPGLDLSSGVTAESKDAAHPPRQGPQGPQMLAHPWLTHTKRGKPNPVRHKMCKMAPTCSGSASRFCLP